MAEPGSLRVGSVSSFRAGLRAIFLLQLFVFGGAQDHCPRREKGCRFAGSNGTVTYLCACMPYVLPEPFNVDRLPRNITALSITGMGSGVHSHYVPLPSLEALSEVNFQNFNLHKKFPIFPLNGLLRLNRFRVKTLTLTDVKLVSLSEADLTGFSQLTKAVFSYCQLTSVNADMFSGLGYISPEQAIVGYIPAVEVVKIIFNRQLTGLDWTFLKPISHSLKEISIKGNGIETANFTCAAPFHLTGAQRFDFTSNRKLFTVPSEIISTFNPNISLSIDVESDFMFCPEAAEGDCRCCDVYHFGKWLLDNNQTISLFYCGSRWRDPKVFDDVIVSIKQGLYRHCRRTGSIQLGD